MTIVDFDKNTAKKLTAFCGGRMSHAVLLTGGSPKVREDAARYIASAIVCESAEARPCGKCAACKKAENMTHPDITVFKKPDDKRFFVKDEVKEVRRDVYRTPNEAEVKAYIFTELQNMNEECQNLLLNILEEPPAYAAFILTASLKNVLLSTVLSRVVTLSLSAADGGRKTADKAVNTAENITAALLVSDEFEIFRAVAPLDGDKELFEATLREMLLMFRDAFVGVSETGKKGTDRYSAEVFALYASLSRAQLLKMYDDTAQILDGFDRNKNQTIMLAVLCAQLRRTALQ